MKIVHIQQYFNQGFGYQENILPSYHKMLGNDVVFLTSTRSDGFNGGNRRQPEGSFFENGFEVKRLPILGEFKYRFVFFKNLYEALENESPDYIFHHSATAPSLLTINKYKKNHPDTTVVIDNHADSQISGRIKLWKWFYYNFLWKNVNRLISANIDKYFGVTPARCIFLNKELGVANEKIELLPIGADTRSIVREKKDRKKLIAELDFPEDALIFCHGGKMSLKKDTDELIKAFKRLELPKARLILFGTFLDKELSSLADSDKRIEYIGWCARTKVLAVLSGSDIGVWNGQHTTLLEDAIACELPLILRRYGSTSHLIESNGLFISSSGAEDVFKAMNEIAVPETLKSVISGAKQMRSKLSYESVAIKSLTVK